MNFIFLVNLQKILKAFFFFLVNFFENSRSSSRPFQMKMRSILCHPLPRTFFHYYLVTGSCKCETPCDPHSQLLGPKDQRSNIEHCHYMCCQCQYFQWKKMIIAPKLNTFCLESCHFHNRLVASILTWRRRLLRKVQLLLNGSRILELMPDDDSQFF